MDQRSREIHLCSGSHYDPNKHSTHIENEIEKAKDEFTEVVQDENQRIQQLANEENERIMSQMRSNETIKICPVCLDEIQPILSQKETNGFENRGMAMTCCNAVHCFQCADKSREHMMSSTSQQCYNCREPIRSLRDWASKIEHDDQRHWLIGTIAHGYQQGNGGLTANMKKAVKLYKRAADLGDANSQHVLAAMYYWGSSLPKKCLKKARYYATLAVEQGDPFSQFILANILISEGKTEKAFQLNSLAAFQGLECSCYALGKHYQLNCEVAQSEDTSVPMNNQEWRKNVLLTTYWYGKAAERRRQHDKDLNALIMFAVHLDSIMTFLWHPRSNNVHDVLPGHSYVPFCTWASNKARQYKQRAPDVDALCQYHHWENVCAICGSREKQKLKACASCNAFHYCSKRCQVKHWKGGHKIDCKVGGHWIESFFPEIRKANK